MRVLGGANGFTTTPVRLVNGNYLRVSVGLYLQDMGDGSSRLKVAESSYQYQVDPDPGPHQIVFRYDYLRYSTKGKPGCHLNVYGTPATGCLPPKTPLSRVHFPTDRVSLESVIRLLIHDFGCEPQVPERLWVPMLEASEQEFRQIAHRL